VADTKQASAAMASGNRLRQTLRELLEVRGYERRRAVVAKAICVSPSALSQYVSGRAQPGLDTLIRLARFFEVSLDYLVFGSDPVRPDTANVDQMSTYIDAALTDLQRRSAGHAHLVGRMSRILAEQIDHAASQAVGEMGRRATGGMLDDADVLMLERFSTDNRIVSKTLKYDVLMARDGQMSCGRFSPVVIRNLGLGYRYRFLFPSGYRRWNTIVTVYRRILAAQGAGDEALTKYCTFRETEEPLPVDFSILNLQLGEVRGADALLYEQIHSSVSPTGTLGLIHAPSEDMRCFVVMDELNRDWAVQCFDTIWASQKTSPVGQEGGDAQLAL
jgi:transcriptional regulator with XRE-family HTH domain